MLFAWTTRLLTTQEQKLYDVAKTDVKAPLTPIDPASVRAISVPEIWFEQPLGNDWVAAFRLVFAAAQNRVVIGEIRIFPSAGPREPQSGRWIAECLGANAPVPRGGITARGVLHKVRLRAVVGKLRRLLKHPAVGRFSVGEAAPVAKVGRKRRGRKPTSDLNLAKAAVVYERGWRNDRSPVLEVVKVLKLKPSTARSRIATARRRGWLEEALDRGLDGGSASPEAHALVRAFLRSQRIATEGKTGGVKAPQVQTGGKKNARQSQGGTKRA